MENKHFFRALPLAALALMMGACGNDEMENGMKDHVAGEFVPMTFTASMDTDADTRTSLVDGKAVHWNGGDNIVVIPSDSEESISNLADYKFSSTLEVGQTAATTSFTGKAPEAETYIAFYPFERIQEYTGFNAFKFNLPNEQKAIPGGFESGINLAWARTESGSTTLQFKNLCTLVKFSLDSDEITNIESVTLQDKEGTAISGEMDGAVKSYNSRFYFQFYSDVASPSVTLKGPFETAKDYYFVVYPLGLKYGFTLTFNMKDAPSPILTSTGLSKDLVPGTILDLGTVKVETTAGTEYITNQKLIENVERDYPYFGWTKDSNGVPLTESNLQLIQELTDLTLIDIDTQEDLEGLEHFTGLLKLMIEGSSWEGVSEITSDIASLDLSKLASLEQLYIEELENLTDLNIKGLENLWYLKCNNGKLSTLDVSGNPNLTYLFCSENELTELNMTGLTKLIYLDCSSNQLTELNVKSFVDLQSLFCNNNRLSQLDITQNLKITLISKYIACGNQTSDGTNYQYLDLYYSDKKDWLAGSDYRNGYINLHSMSE
ncbi:leucine-rich repeat domain-containing protein [Bacteroides togonis]|uniref:leucine-rich repeat domain-containing protein n=1 Tax=Bacteroides togonis TaxID=1917883 RepID=UPI00094AF20F|nr:leucine-rich repeat domain-containing protein [Bacteroides togonis]